MQVLQGFAHGVGHGLGHGAQTLGAHQLFTQSAADWNIPHGAAQGVHGLGHGVAHGFAQGFAQVVQPAANAGAANITATATTNTNNANFFIVIPSFSVMTTIRALKVYMKI